MRPGDDAAPFEFELRLQTTEVSLETQRWTFLGHRQQVEHGSHHGADAHGSDVAHGLETLRMDQTLCMDWSFLY